MLVIFVLSFTALIGFAALAIDLGNTAQSHLNTQNAADAAALAGATALGNGASAASATASAEGVAASYISGIDWAASSNACTPPAPFVSLVSGTKCIAFYPSAASATAIWVEVPPQYLPSLIGRAGSVNVTAASEATFPASATTARLCWGTPGSTGNC